MALDFSSEMLKAISDIKEAKVIKPKNPAEELENKMIISDFLSDESYDVAHRPLRFSPYAPDKATTIVIYVLQLWKRYLSNIDVLQNQAISLANKMGKGEIKEIDLSFNVFIDKEYADNIDKEWERGGNTWSDEYIQQEIDDETKEIVEKIFQKKLNEFIEGKIDRKLSGNLNEYEMMNESFLIVSPRVRDDCIMHNGAVYKRVNVNNVEIDLDNANRIGEYLSLVFYHYNSGGLGSGIVNVSTMIDRGEYDTKETSASSEEGSQCKGIQVRCEFFVKDSMLNHTLNDKQKEMMGLHFEEKMDKYRQEENIPYYVGTKTYLDGRVEKKRPYRIWS